MFRISYFTLRCKNKDNLQFHIIQNTVFISVNVITPVFVQIYKSPTQKKKTPKNNFLGESCPPGVMMF